LIVCVFNNEDLNEVTWEQRVMEGDPKYEASQVIPNFAYAKFAELLGFRGIFVDRAEDLHEAWTTALSADRPVLIEVKTDPEVAPLPPHVTLQQARNFLKAMAGDASLGRVIADTARQVIGG
jgi:pyruvate dehydrogenase (quinone)